MGPPVARTAAVLNVSNGKGGRITNLMPTKQTYTMALGSPAKPLQRALGDGGSPHHELGQISGEHKARNSPGLFDRNHGEPIVRISHPSAQFPADNGVQCNPSPVTSLHGRQSVVDE